jgi:hypothetical protein
MRDAQLTATEIIERHGVSERTAYRWLASGDSRTYADLEPVKVDPLPELKFRALLFDKQQAGFWCYLRSAAEETDAPPVFGTILELYKTKLGPALVELYKLSGLPTNDDDATQ